MQFDNVSFSGGLAIVPPSPVVPGQVEYTTPGTYSWTVPTGITSISAVCVGAGASHPGGGGGGGLRYINDLSVTPGETLTVIVGQSYFYSLAEDSSIKRGSNILVYGGGAGLGGSYNWYGGTGSTIGAGIYGGTIGGGNGGVGGANGGSTGGGGAGAGGYSGNGGNGGNYSSTAPQAGSGGGGGGGGGGYEAGAGGGGVGILGQGASGAAGSTAFNATFGQGGSSGSDGTNGSDYRFGGNGGLYGGGGGGKQGSVVAGSAGTAANGAVRIIWGEGRAFPSTNTANQ